VAVRFLPLDQSDPREIAGYALRARLGSGGMGNVYLSFTRGGRPVAVKVVRREFADDPEFRRRFRQEVTAAQRVQGQFTAPVLDANPDAPVPWLATAYIAGPSLAQAVAEHGKFPVFSVCRLLGGVAEGLSSVHGAGLVHRDLKPANVLLAQDGPRVIDFGIAHAADASSLTGTGVVIGTPAFMAPEQVAGRPVTAATDVFALAHLVLYAATGHTAFGEGHSSAIVYRIANEDPSLEGCPGQLRPILARCLARDPKARPGLAEVMEFAGQQLSGQTFDLVGASWLPDPVAGGLAAFSTSAAPPSPAPSPSPAAPLPDPDPAPAGAVPGPRLGSAPPGSHPSFPSVPGPTPTVTAAPRCGPAARLGGRAARRGGPASSPGHPGPAGHSPGAGFEPAPPAPPGGPGGSSRSPWRGPWQPRVVLPAAAALALVIGGGAYLLGASGSGSPAPSPLTPASRPAASAAGKATGTAASAATATTAPVTTPSASSATPSASPPAALSHATYSTSEPFPICDPNGARWKPVDMIPGPCGQDMQPSASAAGYSFDTVTAFPNGIAVTASNTVTVTGTAASGAGECLGPAEGNSSAGYVALLCNDGTWSIDNVTGLGTDGPVVGKQVATGTFPYDNSKSYDMSLTFGSGTGKLTITFTQGSASPLVQSFRTGQFTPTVVGYAANASYNGDTIGDISGFVYKA
jgi:serine/threonine kinase PknH